MVIFHCYVSSPEGTIMYYPTKSQHNLSAKLDQTIPFWKGASSIFQLSEARCHSSPLQRIEDSAESRPPQHVRLSCKKESRTATPGFNWGFPGKIGLVVWKSSRNLQAHSPFHPLVRPCYHLYVILPMLLLSICPCWNKPKSVKSTL